jgi:membrane-associated protease RseP (regulator of RpoE activity)
MSGSRPSATSGSGTPLRALRALRSVRFLLIWTVVLVGVGAALWHGHLTYLFGVLVFIVALVISVVLHEAGHFLTAKKFGMKATQFFVGFGPVLWSTTRGETEYGVRALPLGAFVKITGMTSVDEVDPEDEPRAMRNKPRWQRAIVMGAGSFMHFALAFVLLIILALAIGQPVASTASTIGSVSPCVAANVKALDQGSCAHSLGNSPARLAGIRAGETIVAVGGRPVHTWTQVGNAIRAQPVGKLMSMTVLLDGRKQTLYLKTASVPGRKGSYIGIGEAIIYQPLSPVSAVSFAGSGFSDVLVGSAQAAGSLPSEIHTLFNRNASSQSGVTSVVGVAQVAGQAVESGGGWQNTVSELLLIIISVNIFIGAFNLLPLLPLDGGHLAMLGYEKVRAWLARLRGRPDPGVADLQPLIPISATVFVILIGIGVLLMAANLYNPVHLIQ